MSGAIEVWAGIECTRNRVGERFFDQLQATGHDRRPDDLLRLAELGAKAVRYPVLWERVEKDGSYDWSWIDERLGMLRELGIRPIVGFVHHGSGPAYTNLLDPLFPDHLARFAAAVAERYPWVRDFTPVNEPLTTARFSGLYGHWYPHGHSDASFVRALLTQCRAVVLAMQAVRSFIPDARLIQTEDMGQVLSTAKLRYQAEFENERRWLSFDLLCGRLDPNHPLWGFLIDRAGADERELAFFQENACPPDVVGLNYYLTSERFLHDDFARFPQSTWGGNGIDRYADVETARVREAGLVGAESLLLQAWDRYGLPLAITECHNGCTREEQLRWVLEVWKGCHGAVAQGADVRALTAWSMFGALDWDSLVTEPRQHYEPGVFDIRSRTPRPTALATLYRTLASGEEYRHPVTDVEGWWARPARFIHGVRSTDIHGLVSIRRAAAREKKVAPLWIVGKNRALRSRIRHDCEARGILAQRVSGEELNLADERAVAEAIRDARPWAIVNAGFESGTRARRATDESEYIGGLDVLARQCAEHGIRLMNFSSDQVFGGRKQEAYLESHRVFPRSAHGRVEAEAEALISALHPSALIVRSGAILDPEAENSVLNRPLSELAAGNSVSASADWRFTLSYLPDLTQNALDLLLDGETGVWHLANLGEISWLELLKAAAVCLNLPTAKLVGISVNEWETTAEATRQHVKMASERGWIMPALDSAITRYCDEAGGGELRLREAA